MCFIGPRSVRTVALYVSLRALQGMRVRTLRLRMEQRVQERGPWGRGSMLSGAVPLSDVRSHFTILNLTSPGVLGEETCPGFLVRDFWMSVVDCLRDLTLGTPLGR